MLDFKVIHFSKSGPRYDHMNYLQVFAEWILIITNRTYSYMYTLLKHAQKFHVEESIRNSGCNKQLTFFISEKLR